MISISRVQRRNRHTGNAAAGKTVALGESGVMLGDSKDLLIALRPLFLVHSLSCGLSSLDTWELCSKDKDLGGQVRCHYLTVRGGHSVSV